MSFLHDPAELARLLALIVPILVAVAAKCNASRTVKTIINLVLTSLTGVTATLVGADGGWAWTAFFDAWLNALVVSIAVYYGVLKPTGVAPAILNATGNIGFGTGPTVRGEVVTSGVHSEDPDDIDYDDTVPPVNPGSEVVDADAAYPGGAHRA